MPLFFVERRSQPNGDHEVHESSCLAFPAAHDVECLGAFGDCSEALAVARRRYHRVNGCVWCATEFHTLQEQVEEVWEEGLPGRGGDPRVHEGAAFPAGWLKV